MRYPDLIPLAAFRVKAGDTLHHVTVTWHKTDFTGRVLSTERAEDLMLWIGRSDVKLTTSQVFSLTTRRNLVSVERATLPPQYLELLDPPER